MKGKKQTSFVCLKNKTGKIHRPSEKLKYVPKLGEQVKTQEEEHICHENFKNNEMGFTGRKWEIRIRIWSQDLCLSMSDT